MSCSSEVYTSKVIILNEVLQLHKQAYYYHCIWYGELHASVLIPVILITDVAVTCKVTAIQHLILKH
jgi:hypothetical protein